jgi:hypothetical protein
MSADEFLALVEKHPLPWKCCADFDESICYDRAGLCDVAGAPISQELADAAPALAAAAIRLLRQTDRYDQNEHASQSGIARDILRAADALRAALPESLRP